MKTKTKLITYDEFISYLHEVGFMPFSKNKFNFASLEDLTEKKSWHTGEETDPWKWRIRVVQDRKAAYAKLFNKKPAFISMDWYPYFLATRRGTRTFRELYADGILSHLAKDIYSLFDGRGVLAAHEIKSLMGVTKETKPKHETAMVELQNHMLITISGVSRKVSAEGKPYGWPVANYMTVEDWLGDMIISRAQKINREEAEEKILARVYEIVPGISEKQARKLVGL